MPVIALAARAPAYASSQTASATLIGHPTATGQGGKTYNFNIQVASGTQTVTGLRMRFTLDPATQATYDIAATNAVAPPTNWTRIETTQKVITYNFSSPIPSTPINAVFQNVRQNSNDSIVLIEVLVQIDGHWAVQDSLRVRFVNGVGEELP